MKKSFNIQSLDWELIPYDFSRSGKILLCLMKIERYRSILDYDRRHNTLAGEQREKLYRLISLWTEVLGEL